MHANGNRITFYNTMQNASTNSWGCPGTQNYSAMSLSGQGVLRFTAPTSSPFVRMLFFANRTATLNGNNEDQIVGGAGTTFDGAPYFKRTPLKFASNSTTNRYTVLVADRISINGTTTLNNNYSSLSNSNPFALYTTGGGLVE
jgi:hypothetical protein